MLAPAERYLTLRSLGAPAVLLSLAMQGVFRGFKDTKTPLYATGMQGVIQLFFSFFPSCYVFKNFLFLSFFFVILEPSTFICSIYCVELDLITIPGHLYEAGNYAFVYSIFLRNI